MKEDSTPTVHAARKIPLKMKDKLKSTLEDMVKEKIIEPVSIPTDWVSSMVVIEKKNGKLRICLDPKELNQAVKRPHYRLPTLEDITSELANVQVFSTFDAKNGYW